MTPTHQTFLFADLAGYTALTEAHGDEVAADVAIEFCKELNRLLPPGAQDVKSLGDACMVCVPDAFEAVALGLALVEDAATDRPFPQVRVGMHTGPAVRRGTDFYGAAVNLAARVAERAGPDEVLLTDATRAALRPSHGLDLRPEGAVALRNVQNPAPLWRVHHETRADDVDPVCRMRIRGQGITRRHEGAVVTLCSAECAVAFDLGPARYVAAQDPR